MIPIPPEIDFNFLDRLLSSIDGLIITGGGDAKKFSKENMPSLREQQPQRYSFEEALLLKAWERDLATIGICRGFQMMAEVFGGRLLERVNDLHKQSEPGFIASHKVIISEGSKLHCITGTTLLEVNSFHVQGVKMAPKGFMVNALSEDGIIEGIEAIDKAFFLGLQFHPEERFEVDPIQRKIFDAFIRVSSK